MRLFRLLAITIVFSGLSPAAQAQNAAPGTDFGNWVVNCAEGRSGPGECRLVQLLTRSADNSLIVRFIAGPGRDTPAVLVAQVPIGVHLPAGAILWPEGAAREDQKGMAWQRCLGEICEAAIALTQADLDQLAAAGGMRFGYRMTPVGDPTIIRVDVSRLGEGIRALGRLPEN